MKRGVATSADGILIAYETEGTGAPALVFVHGWSCDRMYWKGQQDLAKDHRIVTIDVAGHGESGLGRQAWTIPAFGEDVVAVVKELDLPHVVLIGHSMGGDVIVEAARRIRGRVVGLVWVDAYRSLENLRIRSSVEEFAAPFHADFVPATTKFARGLFTPRSDPALVAWVATDMASAPTEVALPALHAAITFLPELLAGLRELKLPVVAINPDYKPTDGASLQRHGVHAVIMDGVGHFLMMEDPPRFNRLLVEAIQEFTPPKPARPSAR